MTSSPVGALQLKPASGLSAGVGSAVLPGVGAGFAERVGVERGRQLANKLVSDGMLTSLDVQAMFGDC
ncbi:MAG: hypothetical protein QOH03_4154 [Kribbellaceae bacterium]|jgi:hypothetical protein|nr:hypothetical protein [Kribbellaceae bacterium]